MATHIRAEGAPMGLIMIFSCFCHFGFGLFCLGSTFGFFLTVAVGLSECLLFSLLLEGLWFIYACCVCLSMRSEGSYPLLIAPVLSSFPVFCYFTQRRKR
jgi:hypothetical protein